MKASISPTVGIKSGMNGFNLCSNSIDCGVYLKENKQNKEHCERPSSSRALGQCTCSILGSVACQ